MIKLHTLNGSPVNPGSHLQFGLWFCTKQKAFCPQTPGHGSLHLFCTHARLSGHSELIKERDECEFIAI